MLKKVTKFFRKLNQSNQLNYAKYLINLKNTEENKESVTEAENRISDLKHTIRNMNEKKKNSADETLKIIKEIFD